MDAFSLALAYGINKIPLRKSLILSVIVGIFHFIMPTIGSLIGITLFNNFITKANIIVAIVFLALAIEMFVSRNDQERGNITNFLSMIAFAFSVSLDSFSVGIALSLTEKNTIMAYITFSIVSFLFTFIGLVLGKKLREKFGHKATYVGIIILTVLAIKYFFSS